ncbi:hypothetical protein ACSBR1_036092 [Camellia fascicularis]
MFSRSTHETIAQKLYQTFKIHKCFTKPKLSRSDFTICHYASDIDLACWHLKFWIGGIETSEDYRFYAISAKFSEFSNKDKTLN